MKNTPSWSSNTHFADGFPKTPPLLISNADPAFSDAREGMDVFLHSPTKALPADAAKHKKRFLKSHIDSETGFWSRKKMEEDLGEMDCGTLVLFKLIEYRSTLVSDNGKEKWKWFIQEVKVFFEHLTGFQIYRFDESTFWFAFAPSTLRQGLLDKEVSEANIERLIRDKLQTLRTKFETQTKTMASFRIGVAINVPWNQSIRSAGIALNSAIERKKDIIFYRIEDEERLNKEEKMQRLIDTALLKTDKNVYFIPYYQPIYNPKNPSEKKVEALARLVVRDPVTWKKTVYLPFAPDNFIPNLKKRSKIPRLTSLIIDCVLSDVKRDPELSVSINIDEQDWATPDIPNKLKKIPPRYRKQICLELLEDCECSTPEDQKQVLSLKEMGYAISLDDYGSERSNARKFIMTPHNYLKIDKGIIEWLRLKDEDQRYKAYMIVKGIVDSCHNNPNKIQVIAEFVEDKEIAADLVALWVDYLQGYHIGRPVEKKELVFEAITVQDVQINTRSFLHKILSFTIFSHNEDKKSST